MRLIDADALIEEIDGALLDSIAEGIAIEKIMEQPTVDAEPIRRGKWIDDNCSECGQYVYRGDMRNYCPCCGARMEE